MWSALPDPSWLAPLVVAGDRLLRLFLAPASLLSLQSLLSALLIAVLWTLGRRRRVRTVRARVLARALFPRRLIRSASSRADIKLTLLNLLVFPVLFGWALLSARAIELWVGGLLPAPAAPVLPGWLAACCATLLLFLAYELGYWLDHYLSHRLPLLWRFHRVHHSAESLSPLTNFRVHPIDSIVFVNIVALVTGTAAALLRPLLGGAPAVYVIDGRNLLGVLALYLITHLLHSHFWVRPPAPFDRLVQSPAHHQLHHSSNPAHYGRNFGASLVLFDWLFGTLLRPSARRPALTFGAVGEAPRHDLWTLLVGPFIGRPRRWRAPTPSAFPAWHPGLAPALVVDREDYRVSR
ncbi:sterol desaturase family protein [Sphingomonas flavalba]|uniref:sterol desaturase family protein n=1 Tax=Sphingomonas flavalba TaxID=2559804 RepID=UPI0039E04095